MGIENRGTASMSEEKLKAAGSAGGRALAPEKRAFSLDRELAARAGRKGGLAVPDEKRPFSKSHELAVECGRRGGLAKARNAKRNSNDAEA
jgi:uncharacterized protein